MWKSELMSSENAFNWKSLRHLTDFCTEHLHNNTFWKDNNFLCKDQQILGDYCLEPTLWPHHCQKGCACLSFIVKHQKWGIIFCLMILLLLEWIIMTSQWVYCWSSPSEVKVSGVHTTLWVLFSTVIGWFFIIICNWSISKICSLSHLLRHYSSIVVLLDHEHPCFWDLYSTISVDVVGVSNLFYFVLAG